LEIILAAEPGPATDPDVAAAVEVAVGPLDGPPAPPRRADPTGVPGVGTVAAPADPGPYLVRVRSPDGESGIFSVTVLPGRTTQLVCHRDAGGRTRVVQFLSGPAAAPNDLRRLETAQQFLARGDVRFALAAVEPLLAPGGLDPVAGCLGGHVLIRQRQADRLRALAAAMADRFPGLPDSHVLAARGHEFAGRPAEAAAAYRVALDRGLPAFADHLRRLARAGIDHPRADRLRRAADALFPGLLWSGWPDDPAPPASRKEPTR
jgi:hypothetical protein